MFFSPPPCFAQLTVSVLIRSAKRFLSALRASEGHGLDCSVSACLARDERNHERETKELDHLSDLRSDEITR